eukprot:SAG31_NODE_1866_length_7025_cov_2.554017_4_plen_47_part_00
MQFLNFGVKQHEKGTAGAPSPPPKPTVEKPHLLIFLPSLVNSGREE